ncbi:MAG: hypothetical protein K0B87_04490 [Candidatus Syntrophosphaera sp.]|nr:hypothetical protein [Candidatus Syntrophosphaera sp.]
MISVKWDKNCCRENVEFPQGWAFFAFLKEGQALWCGYTANLARRLDFVRRKAEEDNVYAEMSSQADTLKFSSCERAIDALIRHKIHLQKQHPQYQQALDASSNYVYLALGANRFPFVSVQSHTNDDWTYLGPWRSRFFLVDVMDSLSRILKIPFCEKESFPCEKLDSGRCRGWCLALEEDALEAEIPNLEKLDSLLKEAYLHPNNGILEMLGREKDKYFNSLEFEKADLLNDEYDNLARYRDWLNFLYVTKSLSFETDELAVERGLLRWCRFQSEEYNFPIMDTQYRDNEKLALNLQDLDEARLIYEYHVKHHKG